jgi:hypothetical protein
MEATIKSATSSFEERAMADRRWGKRRSSPRLAIYYWDGGTPKPHGIRDISLSGVYLLTQEPLFPGAMLLLTMQREDLDESDPDQWIAVHALVVRRDPTGVALSFVFPKPHNSHRRVSCLGNGATREKMARFLSKLFDNDDRHLQASARVSDVSPARTDPGSIFAGAECIRAGRTIGTSKVCICNMTRESLVSSDMSVVDTVNEPLKTLVDDLSHVPSSGFWLTPFRGLPDGLGRCDVIFLDDNNKIAQWAEQFAAAQPGSFRGEHASALVFPSRTISSSHIRVGDQLRICSPDSRASTFTDPFCSIASTTEAGGDKRKQLHCLKDAAPSPADAGSGHALRLPNEAPGASSIDSGDPAMMTRFLRWLFPNIKPADRRRAPRIPAPDFIAFHWAGGEPKAHKVGDVSSSGFYLLTDERWLPGTRIAMTFQKSGCDGEALTDWSRIESEVVRWGTDGVGLEFVAMNSTEILQGNELEKRAFEQFLEAVAALEGTGPHIVH